MPENLARVDSELLAAYGGYMPGYRVAFDGKWQGSFDDRGEALDWGRAAGETGRIAYVARTRWFRFPKLIAIFPEEKMAEGQVLWDTKPSSGGGDSGATGVGFSL